MKNLENVTIICVDCKYYGQSVNALLKCLKEVKPARCLLLTDTDIQIDGIETIKIEPIRSIQEYSHFIIKELWKYFNTSHCLVIQWDGHILNGDCWKDEFYEIDYCGAPWLYSDGRNVGNGGFSLRSQKLQSILGSDDFIQTTDPEDEVVGRLYRRYLEEKYDIKFASEKLADKFSFELRTPIQKTFGFHGHFHKPYKEYICISRKAALGDVVQLEPVLEHFHKNGYNVILDTLPQFFNLFIQHYFKIYHPQEIDPRIKYRTIVLDMAYENFPEKLHQKSYFECCGINDYKLRNPKLSLDFDVKQNKLFPKYVCVHIDSRPQPARNIYGIEWDTLVSFFKEKGYVVIQIGNAKNNIINSAVQMSTPTELLLSWVIGGSDVFIGCDSGPSNIAVAFDVPSIIFTGSVNLTYIHADLSNILWLHNHEQKICRSAFCWHSVVGCEGVECIETGKKEITMTQGAECIENASNPPCVNFDTDKTINKVREFLCQKKLI